ncbi:hypothetical protein AArcMg_2300 [Natrarchaeobaculum sulfurireducens]|uniref:Uncharacterized protein n=1 Tax=Natrarchaeobaculum sulfurireducens TaxID=2044521 RepID=A0A346PS01_9EURY|nr:hypothetical protein AArcMg_2300 [Natrarchaeobaculum sulfurireducens]
MGPKPHARQEVSPTNSSDARCACGARADGHDALRNEPICVNCARVRTDGGTTPAERQAQALETIANELRFQNAALAEVINVLDAMHGERRRPLEEITTSIKDHLIVRGLEEVA